MERVGKAVLLAFVVVAAWKALLFFGAPPPDRETVVVEVDERGWVCVPARQGLDRAETECGANETGSPLRAGDCVKISYDDETHGLRADSKIDCPT